MGITFFAEGYEEPITVSPEVFKGFKKLLAARIGIVIEDMAGSLTPHPRDGGFVKRGWIPWREVKSPLKLFLQGFTVGKLPSLECDAVYPAIDEAIGRWERCFVGGGTLNYEERLFGASLVKIMRYCAQEGKELQWG